jgi:hypothetical protein
LYYSDESTLCDNDLTVVLGNSTVIGQIGKPSHNKQVIVDFPNNIAIAELLNPGGTG